MTKAERQRMENLEKALRLARALRWPDYPMPPAMSKEDIEANKIPGGERYGQRELVARGWFVNTYQNGRVSHGCSNGIHHSSNGDTPNTQDMGQMHFYEVEAWQHLRIAKTEEYARHLAEIDTQIDRAKNSVERSPVEIPES